MLILKLAFQNLYNYLYSCVCVCVCVYIARMEILFALLNLNVAMRLV